MNKCVYAAPECETQEMEFDSPIMGNSTDYHYGGGFGDDDE